MEKFNLNLQLFADDTQTSTETTPEGTETTSKENSKADDKKTESQAKYTDEDVNKIIDKKFAEWQKNGYIRNFGSFRWRAELLPEHFL